MICQYANIRDFVNSGKLNGGAELILAVADILYNKKNFTVFLEAVKQSKKLKKLATKKVPLNMRAKILQSNKILVQQLVSHLLINHFKQ